jgi:small-conductance mechanosensitive channel
MLDTTDLITVGSIVAAFSAVVIFFRIDRELKLKQAGISSWIPWADRLVISSSIGCLLLAILPLLLFGRNHLARAVATSACSGSIILVTGYVPAILAHYRLIFGRTRTGLPIENPEPAERVIVLGSSAVAAAAALVLLIVNLQNPSR